MSEERQTKTSQSFEKALQELEKLVASLESGDLTLEKSIVAYKRGVALVRQCSEQLARVDQQVKLLDGELLRPFEPDEQEKEND